MILEMIAEVFPMSGSGVAHANRRQSVRSDIVTNSLSFPSSVPAKGDSSMFTRVVELKCKSGKTNELCSTISGKVLPVLRKQQGFQDEIVLVSNTRPNQLLTLSFWNSDKRRSSRAPSEIPNRKSSKDYTARQRHPTEASRLDRSATASHGVRGIRAVAAGSVN
jgi:hypothetical protein